MSFILDALKRAERDRRLERPPDLKAVYEETPPPRRAVQPWLWVSSAFLVGAAAVVFFLWPDAQAPSRPDQPTQTVTIRSNVVKAPPAKTPAAPARPVSPPVKTVQPAEPPPVQTARTQPPSPSAGPSVPSSRAKASGRAAQQPSESSVPTPSEAPREMPSGLLEIFAAKSRAKRGSPPPEEPVKSAIPVPSVSEAPTAEPEKRPSIVMDTPAKPAALPAETVPALPGDKGVSYDTDQLAAIPLYSELPTEVREKLGKLEINVHSYSENPAECLVFINMRKLKVGDAIGEDGPVLKQITPEGAVIDYGEGQVRLRVWR